MSSYFVSVCICALDERLDTYVVAPGRGSSGASRVSVLCSRLITVTQAQGARGANHTQPRLAGLRQARVSPGAADTLAARRSRLGRTISRDHLSWPLLKPFARWQANGTGKKPQATRHGAKLHDAVCRGCCCPCAASNVIVCRAANEPTSQPAKSFFIETTTSAGVRSHWRRSRAPSPTHPPTRPPLGTSASPDGPGRCRRPLAPRARRAPLDWLQE